MGRRHAICGIFTENLTSEILPRLVSPTHTLLCAVFDPLCNKPYILLANCEDLVIVNYIAEHEGIEATPQKRGTRSWVSLAV